MGDATKRVHKLYEKYGITDEETGPPKRKKKKKGWLRTGLDAVLETFRQTGELVKPKKKPEEITRPAGVRTAAQIAEWKDIMEIGKKKKK